MGAVQGLGEFLPISSSAHLVLAPWFFNWPDPGLGFDVALHWGTLLAVLVYFRRDVLLLGQGFWLSLFKKTRNFKTDTYQKLSWLILFASIPGAIIGKIFEQNAETVFRNPLLIAITLSLFGIVLLLVDSYSKKHRGLHQFTVKDSLIIGFSQALALIPGVSRSGSTITAAMLIGIKRPDAARFSFLMSIPIIFGAGLLKINHFHDGVTTSELFVGFITSAFFGFLSIKYLLRLIANNNFKIFVWYRFLLAAVIILTIFARR